MREGECTCQTLDAICVRAAEDYNLLIWLASCLHVMSTCIQSREKDMERCNTVQMKTRKTDRRSMHMSMYKHKRTDFAEHTVADCATLPLRTDGDSLGLQLVELLLQRDAIYTHAHMMSVTSDYVAMTAS